MTWGTVRARDARLHADDDESWIAASARRERLETVNRTQRDVPPVRCAVCGGT